MPKQKSKNAKMTKANYFKGFHCFRGLTSSWLKIIAIAAMALDHAALIFIGPEPGVLRCIGRIAFPIFAYMIAEGARRTSDSIRYLVRLFVFALISEIPYDLATKNSILEFSSQNVFFTLALGLISIEFYNFLKNKNLGFLAIITTLLLAAAAGFIKSDYGAMGVICCTLLYFYSDKSTPEKIIGSAVSITLLMFAITGFSLDKIFIIPSEKWALFALIPIMLYNGEKGLKINKYFFYAFYPAHLLLFAALKYFIS